MKQRKKRVGAFKTVNMQLAEKTDVEQEVVITGEPVSNIKKATSTKEVKAEEIADQNATNVTDKLQGAEAGVNVNQSSGAPGSSTNITIRGLSSINGSSQPLFIVDGVPINTSTGGAFQGQEYNPLSTINPADIESIEILTDASEIAKYGARGANGVIKIKTKNGSAGKTKFNFSYTTSVGEPTNKIDLVGAPDYLTALDEGYANTWTAKYYDPRRNENTPVPTSRNPYLTVPNHAALTDSAVRGLQGNDPIDTDWLDYLFQQTISHDLSFSASGGNEKTLYYLNTSYRDEDWMLRGGNFKRYSGRFNLQNNATRILKLGVRSSVTFTRNNVVPTGSSSAGGGFGVAQTSALPIFPVFWSQLPSGLQNVRPSEQEFNPYFNAYYQGFRGTNIALTQNPDFQRIQKSDFRSLITSFINLKLYDSKKTHLNFQSEFGFDFSSDVRNIYTSRFVTFGSNAEFNQLPTTRSVDSRRLTRNLNWNNFLTFDSKFNKDHEMSAMLSMRYQRSRSFFNNVGTERFINDYNTFVSAGTVQLPGGAGGNETEFAFLTFLGSMEYLYKNKWIGQTSLTYDGTSRFGTNNQFGFFPSAGLAYLLSEEDFIKQRWWIDYLKVKASTGLVGNAGASNFESYSFATDGTIYNLQPGLAPANQADPAVTWERNWMSDLTIETGLFKNARQEPIVDFKLAFFNRETYDMLLNVRQPLSNGLQSTRHLSNLGRMRNTGIEFDVTTQNITSLKKDGFNWETSFNITYTRNRLLDIGNLEPSEVTGSLFLSTVEGEQMGVFSVVEYAGVAQEDKIRQDGTYEYHKGDELVYLKDENGNRYKTKATRVGQIDSSRAFLTQYRRLPVLYGGFKNKFEYKNVDFSFLFTYQWGNYVMDIGERNQSYIDGSSVIRQSVFDNAYHPERNPNGDQPRFLYSGAPDVNMRVDDQSYLEPFTQRNSSRFIHDASFIRLKNVTLGYTLPLNNLRDKLNRKLFFRYARVYVGAQNLLTFTNFPGWDPEVFSTNNSNGNLRQGITQFDLPQLRSYSFGVNLSF